MRIRDIASLPRRVQPVRHIISRKRRHREMQERAAQFRAMLEREIKRLDKKEGEEKADRQEDTITIARDYSGR